MGALREAAFALGAVVEGGQGGQAAVDVGAEPLGPAGVGAQRYHEPDAGRVGSAQPSQVAKPGVDDADHPGRGQLPDAFERGGDTGGLVRRAGVRPVVDSDPAAGAGLQGLDLAGDRAVGGPPLLDQRRAGVAAGEPDRGHVQVQPRQVGPAPGRGGKRQFAAHRLGHRRQRLQCAAEPPRRSGGLFRGFLVARMSR